MVFYHAGAPGKNFVYLFHMDLFFISSGYCYRHDSEKKPWEYVKREILTLYVLFVVSCIVLVSLQNLILETYIFSCDVYNKLTLGMWLKEVMKCFFFVGAQQMLGANWFFRTLFVSSILFIFLKLKNSVKFEAYLCLVPSLLFVFIKFTSSFSLIFFIIIYLFSNYIIAYFFIFVKRFLYFF